MSNDDSLLRAAKALRNANYTSSDRSKSTRARIIMSLNATRERRLRRWFAAIPFGVLVLGGSAWAQSSGHLSQWLETLEEVSVRLVADSGLNPLAKGSKRASLKSTEPSASELGPEPEVKTVYPTTSVPGPTVELAPLEPQAISNAIGSQASAMRGTAVGGGLGSDAVSTLPRAALTSLPGNERRAQDGQASLTSNARNANSVAHRQAAGSSVVSSSTGRLNVAPVEAVVSSQRPVLESDAELALFRVAHDLHFKQAAPQASIAAHRAYLASYPRGRFVPEALYNIAVDQLRSGDRTAAQRQLEIFAAGRYGGYRQREAQQLLRVMDGPAP